ncbi:fumarylacetoacetate hydrolase family protein [Psychroflexus sp. ALD_RP9]|uniref:fumarylacetoacetate hydrolase family protein n=1 Tax=Psychroflexus sp. ALD_RP9 TaxID=2777186 RepID=UPI001A902A23|nr:fumarylacetoacetate hydrolase family protein [Psychroflexus sp. ALD_RP9]QSS96461.1 fumarylacetoacetate hydrolase family protein [Psychroflexus sp. ALD_RP9]
MKIICIGRNYNDHISELGNQKPEAPVIFLKPDSSVLPKNQAFFIPEFSNNIHYELEVVIKINRLGKHIDQKFAHKYYQEVGLGIDFTARDLQQQLKQQSLPWEKAKGFDGSCVLGNKWLDKSQFEDLQKLNFSLTKNDQIVQQGNTRQMIFSIDEIIANVSQYFTLKIGDLIFTGTPAGVGPIEVNDHLKASLEDHQLIDLRIK